MKVVSSQDKTPSSNSPQPHPKSCSNKKKNQRAKRSQIQTSQHSLSRRLQTNILQWTSNTPSAIFSGRNIEPSGDPLLPRKCDDGIFRAASNNINGSTFNKSGFDVAHDLSVTDEYGIDIMALQETKHPWTGPNRRLYDMQTKLLWPTGAKTTFSSAPWEHGDIARTRREAPCSAPMALIWGGLLTKVQTRSAGSAGKSSKVLEGKV